MSQFLVIPALGTHRGLRREFNEDAVGFDYPSDFDGLLTRGVLFVVADGVAGLREGERASQLAVRWLMEAYKAAPGLKEAVQQVNQQMLDQLPGSATTMTAAALLGEEVILVHVGDGAAYWVNEAGIEKLTTEHVLVSDGTLSPKLTHALGNKTTLTLDYSTHPLSSGGKLLLVTDGVTRYIPEKRLFQLTAASTPAQGVQAIIEECNQAGGADNISVVVVEISQPCGDEATLTQHLASLGNPLLMLPDSPSTRPAFMDSPIVLSRAAQAEETPGKIESRVQTENAGYKVQSSLPRAVASTPAPTRSRLPWLLIGGIALLLIALVAYGLSQPASSTTTPTPLLPSATITESLSPAPQTGLQEGMSIVFAGSALTYEEFEADGASAFVIKPNLPYQIERIYTDRAGITWYQLYDAESEQYGWIAQEQLPPYQP